MRYKNTTSTFANMYTDYGGTYQNYGFIRFRSPGYFLFERVNR